MSNGANAVQIQLRKELENYIISQYFSKSPILLSAINSEIDREGLLYKEPFIESSPAYRNINNGIQNSDLPDWLKNFFKMLSDADLGVYPSPFVHQIEALENAYNGKDLFVATGTGSGKTECFMWPILAKLVSEARNNPNIWEKRGIRTIIMYPMNALVSDQVSRLRRLIGDSKGNFIDIFRTICEKNVRRPQFGMYTGRTPYPGETTNSYQDKKLERTLARMSFPESEEERDFFEKLTVEGKIPAKSNMNSFLERLHKGQHIPDDEDAELVTRFEMQQFCPDILITNYSMLEFMLLRPRENKIWADTKAWLHASPENKLLFVIDEAHMYRGSSGGEVALLIRRLFHKLEIGRDKVQFILTTASMPNSCDEDKRAVKNFANNLTAVDGESDFCYLTGEREKIEGKQKYDIPFSKFLLCNPADFEGDEILRLSALSNFWGGLEGCTENFENLNVAYYWMYDNLIKYRPFYEMLRLCRGEAISLKELAAEIFPNEKKEEAIFAVSILLAIAPLAKNDKGSVLFPARMHMLFRGIKGVYACPNENCPNSHTDEALTLGDIFLSDGQLVCPHCNSMVYELYNDRRCGALFFKAFVLEDDIESQESVYLWRYPGQLIDKRMKEIHLFIPKSDFALFNTKSKYPIRPCYLDIKSGFVNFRDDSWDNREGIRKLYYCNYTAKGRPNIITFPTCPHCRHQLSQAQLTSFSTRGNQSFFNLIKAQFQSQPAVPKKVGNNSKLPNEGRKVLVFSDSRQRAAKLARDMSEYSDISAARQLFAVAVDYMEQSTQEQSMNMLYDYFCLAAAKHNVHIFHEPEKAKFADDCASALNSYNRSIRRNRGYSPRFTIDNAPIQMKEYLLRLFCGGYNTLWDSATCWIEPTDNALVSAVDTLEESGIEVSDEEFLEVFNAWILYICDTSTALGHTISDTVRLKVRSNYSGYGLQMDWNFSANIQKIMGWEKKSKEIDIWRKVLKDNFLDNGQTAQGKLYVDLSRVKPRFLNEKVWYRCDRCSEITPYLLHKHCPSCGSECIHAMTEDEYESMNFWRKPIEGVLKGEKIHVIDTEEHTAQLSHKDQRDEMWSKTEQYELRFQDLIKEDETPVDILSSTTTMEVGIDIGSLVAVGLRNIPPMRENYQQRAGRAGRRGSSLSTIVTFCEDGPHDTLYFNDPIPMFRGDPRRPWIDIESEKLIQRHLYMVIIQDFLLKKNSSLDSMSAAMFLDNYLNELKSFMLNNPIDVRCLLPKQNRFDKETFISNLLSSLSELKEKRNNHPELFGVSENDGLTNPKSLLDALYEEGIVPTYSFPKNVVSTYISDFAGKLLYQVERGLDVAIGEYAPGRAIVVDKQTYQIGGLYYPGSERRKNKLLIPARSFIEDPNYLKNILSCSECGWFGLEEEKVSKCPFCGNSMLELDRQMLRPWGFAPKNAESIQEVQLNEEYSFVQQPIYSTLPEADEMVDVLGYTNVRVASRTNQRIIMVNNGTNGQGFMVCRDCGAAMPGENSSVLENVNRPYKSQFIRSKCKHLDSVNVNLGYDFVTDMLVLEFKLDSSVIDVRRMENLWLPRAAQSLAEALRLTASKELDVEFTELVTGYRLRRNAAGTFVDVYLYDSLSSGAGYAASIADIIDVLLEKTEKFLLSCDCYGACYQCLKHYRNQHIHGVLDRFYALDLLRWGRNGTVTRNLPEEEQEKLLLSLSNILKRAGYEISENGKIIVIEKGSFSKRLKVYPAMCAEPHGEGVIYISEAMLKYAKPYAVRKIFDEF